MALLFCVSTDLGGTRHTSRFIRPLLRWLVPSITENTLEHVHFRVRKAGHALGYAILAGLLWRACAARDNAPTATWNRRRAGLAWFLATLYAASDEWHQTFTATRHGSVHDVLLDSFGAALGVGFLWLWWRWSKARANALSGTL